MTSLSDIYQITLKELAALIEQTDLLDPASPVRLKKNLSDSTLAQIPFLASAESLLNLIALQPNQSLKLTARGALPVKYVKELYAQSLYKDPPIAYGYTILAREDSSDYIGMLHFILQQTPYTTCKNNALCLSPKGKKWLNSPDRTVLLQVLFNAFINKYLLSSLDGLPNSDLIQYSIPWTMYMLLIHQKSDIPAQYLTELLFFAYPGQLDVFEPDSNHSWQQPALVNACNAYKARVFTRCLDFFGWTQHSPKPFSGSDKTPCVGASQLLRDCFELHQRKPIAGKIWQKIPDRTHH